MSELPASWVKTTLGQVVSYADNETADPADMPPVAWLLELEDIERDTGKVLERKTVGERVPKSSKNRFQDGDVLYGKLRPYLNKVVRADQDGFCSSEIIAISPGLLDKNYLFYSMRSPNFIEYVSSVSHGMRMPRLGTQQAKSAPFLLPPRAEQTRIAAKLGELLAQVDTLKARIDGIPALLKRFRQSVLAAAVSGRLTEEWRDVNGIELPTRNSINDLSEIVTKGASPKWQGVHYVEDPSQTLFVTSENVRSMYLDLAQEKYVEDEFNSLQSRSILCPGDVLTNIVGASIGRAAVWRSDRKANTNQAVCIIRPRKEFLLSDYLSYYLNSPEGISGMTDEAVDVARANVSLAVVKGLQILLPRLEEQTEIVRRVEQLFAFADQVEAKVTSTQSRIELLTQSILAKAFRGDLVPQDPNDEPARLLLERIKAQRAAAPRAKRARKNA